MTMDQLIKNPYAFPQGIDAQSGITKRELAAMENHAHLLRLVQRGQMSSRDAAVLAVQHADALLEELEQSGGT